MGTGSVALLFYVCLVAFIAIVVGTASVLIVVGRRRESRRRLARQAELVRAGRPAGDAPAPSADRPTPDDSDAPDHEFPA